MKLYEDVLLYKCHTWLWNTYPETRYLAYHIPNERNVPPLVQAQMRSKGVVKGVSDYVFHWHVDTLLAQIPASYFFEMKSPDGVQSPEQKLHQAALEAQGFKYYLIKQKASDPPETDLRLFQRIIHEILGY